MSDVDKNLISKFNKEISIYELVIRSGIVLKKKGKNYMGLCPFHSEKTPSFSVSIEKNIALCMACHTGGKPITFYSKLKNISLQTTIQELSKLFNLELPQKKKKFQNPFFEILESAHYFFKKSLLLILEKEKYDHPLREYLLQKRKLNLELIKNFGLGYAYDSGHSLKEHLLEKKYKLEDLLKLGLIYKTNYQNTKKERYFDFFQNRIIFPLTDSEGRIVGFCGRLFEDIQDKIERPKYLFNIQNDLFKKDNLLYRYFEHQDDIQKKKEVILCEGFFDVISLYKINIKNTVATLGIHLNQKQIILLQKITKNIIIAFDGDTAGKEATQKVAQELNKKRFRIKILNLPSNLDPDQYILDKESDNLFLQIKFKEMSQEYIFQKIDELIQKDLNKQEIKKNVENLLKYHNIQTKEYFQNKINEKYQIKIDLIIGDSISKKTFQLLQQSKLSIKNIISNYEKEINILIEVFLNPKYINFIIEESYKYRINSDIVELLYKIKEYYDQLTTEDEKDLNENRIHFFNFKKIYKSSIEQLNSPIVNELLQKIEKDPFFSYKQKFKNHEYLSSFFYPFQLEKYFL
ncbi:MAG: DNA primase [Candidatus Phytoplasma stylosanthis]|nr:DNA primase [Candidatus Phytoplasma stylosanthis]